MTYEWTEDPLASAESVRRHPAPFRPPRRTDRLRCRTPHGPGSDLAEILVAYISEWTDLVCGSSQDR